MTRAATIVLFVMLPWGLVGAPVVCAATASEKPKQAKPTAHGTAHTPAKGEEPPKPDAGSAQKPAATPSTKNEAAAPKAAAPVTKTEPASSKAGAAASKEHPPAAKAAAPAPKPDGAPQQPEPPLTEVLTRINQLVAEHNASMEKSKAGNGKAPTVKAGQGKGGAARKASAGARPAPPAAKPASPAPSGVSLKWDAELAPRRPLTDRPLGVRLVWRDGGQ